MLSAAGERRRRRRRRFDRESLCSFDAGGRSRWSSCCRSPTYVRQHHDGATALLPPLALSLSLSVASIARVLHLLPVGAREYAHWGVASPPVRATWSPTRGVDAPPSLAVELGRGARRAL